MQRHARTKSRTSRSKASGLRRPKTSLSFQVSSKRERSDSVVISNATLAVDGLEKHILMLDLIIRRNKNQHRAQAFFKYIWLLRTSTRKLLAIQKQLQELQEKTPLAVKADEVRQRFEKESGLHGQVEVLQEQIREILVPKCFVFASALVGDSQFANLGVVLVGLVADIAAGEGGVGLPEKQDLGQDLVGALSRSVSPTPMQRLKDSEEGPVVTAEAALFGTSTRVTGEDQGEVIERRYAHSGLAGLSEETCDDRSHSRAQPRVSTPVEHTEAPQDRLSEGFAVRTISGIDGQEEPDLTTRQHLRSSKGRDGVIVTTKKSKRRKNAIDDIFSGLL